VRQRLSFRYSMVVSATVLAAVVAPQLASAASREEPIGAEIVVMTQASGSGCHASIFAVVNDLPDAAEYRVIWTRTDAPGREYTEIFNRHYRGHLQFSKFPTWSPGTGKVAGLLGAHSGDGPGSAEEDCVSVRAADEARYAVARATVVRYTPNAPAPKAAAYELSSVATGPAKHGPTGLDGCTLGHFVSFPAVPGAVRYRITVTDTLFSSRPRTKTKVVEASKVNPTPPAETKLRPYKKAGRIGHFLFADKVGGWGCVHAEWEAAESIEKVSVKAEKA
jgi:hypothetical protein